MQELKGHAFPGSGGESKARYKCKQLTMLVVDGCVNAIDMGIVLMGPVLALLASSLFSFIVYVYCMGYASSLPACCACANCSCRCTDSY